MNDIKVLEDAFAELERQADVFAPRPETSRRRPPLLVPALAAVLAAAGLAIGVVALTPDHGPRTPAPGGGSATTTTKKPATTSTIPTKLYPNPAIPADAKELTGEFRAILDGSATFTVTDTGAAAETNGTPDVVMVGAAIVGMLTKSGVTGGYDLQIYPAEPTDKAWCDTSTHCTKTTLPDGSSLAVNTDTLEPMIPGSICYGVNLVRKDGVEVLMHVCNTKDSKGQYGGPTFAPKPPLTTDEMVAIVTSRKW